MDSEDLPRLELGHRNAVADSTALVAPAPLVETTDHVSEVSPEVQNQSATIFKRIVWRRMLSIGESIETYTTFTLTGVAALVAVVIGNLGGVGDFVSEGGLKLGIVFFAASLLVGAVSKLMGIAVRVGVASARELESALASDSGKLLLQNMVAPPEQLSRELAEPFPWPLSLLIERAAVNGSKDPIAHDRTYIHLFCVQILANLLQWVFGLTGILIFAFSMTSEG